MNEENIIKKDKPVILVSRDISYTFPLSYAYLAGYLLEKGENVELFFRDKSNEILVEQLIDGIKKLKRPIEYSISARFDILKRMDDDLLRDLKDSGCRIMGLGIESGSDRILKDIIGKKYTKENVIDGLRRLKKAGILPTVSIMVGQHTETIEDVEESIDLMRQSVREDLNIQYAFTITTPFPGTDLYNLLLNKGYLKDDEEFYEKYFSNSSEWNQVVNLSAMTGEVVFEMLQKIKNSYREELRLVTSNKVYKLERLQIFFIRVKKKLIKTGRQIIPNKRFNVIVSTFIGFMFSPIQITLEKLVLNARGIR